MGGLKRAPQQSEYKTKAQKSWVYAYIDNPEEKISKF